MKTLVTGGAGFIGSHLVDRLISEGNHVIVYDNFKTGFRQNLQHHQNHPNLKVVEADVLDLSTLQDAMKGIETVFHFQANADVRGGMANPRIDLEQNTIATWNVLEAARANGVKNFLFASSATVYGEPQTFPTPEASPLIQTSLYGASKLAGEAMIQAYAEYYQMRTLTFRFVSWIGTRYSHGVIYDFVKKLKNNPRRLEVLGDGNQKKSYLDVRDGTHGIWTAYQNFQGNKGIFNLGHDEFMNVLDLARIVADEMGLQEVELVTTGGERGWLGDSPIVHLETSNIKSLGWSPQVSIEDGIRSTVRYLLDHPWLIQAR